MTEVKEFTLEDATRLIARLRTLGVRIINAKGEDLTEAEIEAIFNEVFSC
jgi:hypothetical protein